MTDRTYRVTEIVGTSPEGIDQAIHGLEKQRADDFHAIGKLLR